MQGADNYLICCMLWIYRHAGAHAWADGANVLIIRHMGTCIPIIYIMLNRSSCA